MPSAKQQKSFKKLKEFFSSEIQMEARSGFRMLARVPDSRVVDRLRYYGLLSENAGKLKWLQLHVECRSGPDPLLSEQATKN